MGTHLAPEHLVALLASPQERVRTKAHARLAELGLHALPALKAGMRHPNANVRARCAGLHRQARRAERGETFGRFWQTLKARTTRRKAPPLPDTI